MKQLKDEKIIGSYGTFRDPVIELEDGSTVVAELHYILPNGEMSGTVCQSDGCDYCDGYHNGCRFSSNNKGLRTAYFF
jgi:hypothetical protein